jgi:hypothetical protein
VLLGRPGGKRHDHAQTERGGTEKERCTKRYPSLSGEPRARREHGCENERYRLRQHANSEQKAAGQPEDDVARSPIRDERGDGECYQQADVDVAVPVLADEEYRHGVECDTDEQRSTDGARSRSDRYECQVQRDDESGLGQDQVDPECCPERDVDMAGDGVEQHDDLQPERWPVQHPRLVGVLSVVLGFERTLPVVDVEGMRIADREDEYHSCKPGDPEDDGEI